MRHLLIFRHAEAARPAGVQDFDRPLTAKGREAARRMGPAMAETAPAPSLALVSPARRTRETYDLAAPAFASPPRLAEDEGLYDADVTHLLARLREVPDGEASVLLVGHNEGLEDLARSLAGDGEPEARARLDGGLPTGALALYGLNVPWADLKPGDGRLMRLIAPADLGN